MIKPTKDDIGRSVIYIPNCDSYFSLTIETQDEEIGVITSFNDAVVFVRFGSEKQAKAIYRKDLFWPMENKAS